MRGFYRENNRITKCPSRTTLGYWLNKLEVCTQSKGNPRLIGFILADSESNAAINLPANNTIRIHFTTKRHKPDNIILYPDDI